MSPNWFSVGTTSYSHGSPHEVQRHRVDVASSAARSGWRFATSQNTLRKSAKPRCTFALSTQVTRPFPGRGLALRSASRNANSNTRSEPLRVMRPMSKAASSVGRGGCRGVVAPVEPAFGLLAHQHEVDLSRARIGAAAAARRESRGSGAHRRRDRGDAQVELRRDLGAVGIAHVGQAHRAEEDRIGASRTLSRRCRGTRRRCRGTRRRRRVRLVPRPKPPTFGSGASTARQASMTSTPMPSPGRTTIVKSLMVLKGRDPRYWSSRTLAVLATCDHFSISLRMKSV